MPAGVARNLAGGLTLHHALVPLDHSGVADLATRAPREGEGRTADAWEPRACAGVASNNTKATKKQSLDETFDHADER